MTIFYEKLNTSGYLLLQGKLKTISRWYNSNGLHLNSKICNILFCMRSNPIYIHYDINAEIIQRPDHMRVNLGITFDVK